MRVLLLLRSLGRGGAERQASILAPALAARGHAVEVATWYPGGPFHRELERAGIPVRSADKRGRWDLAGFARRLARIARAFRPDVVYSMLPGPNLAALALRRVVSRGRFVWAVATADVRIEFVGRLDRLLFATEARLARFADAVVANSRAGARWAVRNGFPSDRVVVVPNGVDVQRFRSDPEARAAVRRAWGVAPCEPLVGRIGRLDRFKDYPGFVEAAARVARERPGARFVCVGGGSPELQAACAARVRALGLSERFIWAGPCDDMPRVYAALDVLASTSVTEGMPNNVGEAMACGVPCAVTDVGDSAWLVGDTGAVVPPCDPDAMAAAILALLDRPRDGAARARIEACFDVDRFVRRTETLLQAVLAGPNAVREIDGLLAASNLS